MVQDIYFWTRNYGCAANFNIESYNPIKPLLTALINENLTGKDGVGEI